MEPFTVMPVMEERQARIVRGGHDTEWTAGEGRRLRGEDGRRDEFDGISGLHAAQT